MKVPFICLILIIASVVSCQSHSGSPDVEDVGKFDKDGRETGIWFLKDSLGRVMETGRFDSGLIVGTWKYYSPIEEEWEWEAIYSPNSTIKTSFPEFVRLEENYDSLLIASSIDTAIGFTAIVSNITSLVSSVSEYSDSVFSDLTNQNIKIIDSARQIIETEKGQQYVFHHIRCLKPNSDTVQVFNMATIIDRSKIMEITVRCENRLELFGRRTFYSIVPHTFINNKRFLDQTAKIIKKIGRREY